MLTCDPVNLFRLTTVYHDHRQRVPLHCQHGIATQSTGWLIPWFQARLEVLSSHSNSLSLSLSVAGA